MVPRAAGTGLAAGAVATFGGVIISIERMNNIIEIDKDNMVCVTEPGVTTAVLQESVQKEGLFYGGDPAVGTLASSAVTLLPTPAVTALSNMG